MNSYDAVIGIGSQMSDISIKELISLIKQTTNVRKNLTLAGVNITDPDIELDDFEEYETPANIIVECMNEIADVNSFGVAIDDNGDEFILFVEKAPWNYTPKERNLTKDTVIHYLENLLEPVIKSFEIEDLCIANRISD